ncbi:UDP-4-amino-4-deoxy-L-arabinose--oxoglutarate aminotransferase [compost metagenome]
MYYAGAPFDLDPLYALADKHDIAVIQNAAHAAVTQPERQIAEQRPGRRFGVVLADETAASGFFQHDKQIEIWPCLSC